MTDTNFWYLSKGVDVRLSEHFRSHEFDCKCSYDDCTLTTVSKKLIELLEVIRWVLGRPLVINSGYRCERHNRESNGEKDSYHMRGMAADVKATRNEQRKIEAILKGGGFKSYHSFCHVDVRRERWRG